MRKLTDFQQLIDDVAGDAMSDALDMDVGVGELSDAASIELSEKLHEVFLDELMRIGQICSPNGVASLGIRAGASPDYRVAITVYPNGDNRPSLSTFFAATIPDAIAKAEEAAAEWVQSHRVMCAQDLGIAA